MRRGIISHSWHTAVTLVALVARIQIQDFAAYPELLMLPSTICYVLRMKDGRKSLAIDQYYQRIGSQIWILVCNWQPVRISRL